MIFSVAVAFPIHGYDLCCYAPGIALIATRIRRYQAALFVPALIIWRPALVHKFKSYRGARAGPDVGVAKLTCLHQRHGRPGLQFGHTSDAKSPGLGAAEVDL